MERHINARTDEQINEKYLNNNDSLLIMGYDLCAGEAGAFENSLMGFDPLLENGFFDTSKVDIDVIESDKHYSEFTKEEIDALSPETRAVKFIFDNLLCTIEDSRNAIITSLIEDMDKEEYETNKRLADNGEYINCLTYVSQEIDNEEEIDE